MLRGIHRHLFPETILLDLDAYLDVPGDYSELSEKERRLFKESVLGVLVKLFERTGSIVNASKCLIDLVNRESRASTAMGNNIAIPHVRTLQARDFLVSVMRSDRGIYFDGPEGEMTHIFIGILAPPYADRDYLRFLSLISRAFASGGLKEDLMKAGDVKEVMGVFCRIQEE